MRIKFSGVIAKLEPIVLMYTSPGADSFDKTVYPDHTNYEIMVIGGGGGEGGRLHGDDPDNSWETYAFGGQGGGGGSHRMRGLLEFLDDSTDIVVGDAGAAGTDAEDSGSTDGSDGEYSSFGDFLLASGGLGGLRAATLSADDSQAANGGDGGIGGTTTAGGGGAGGICGIPLDGYSPSGIPAETGPLVIYPKEAIGRGGGGGAGGASADKGSGFEIRDPKAQRGGDGSYNSDELYFAPGTRREKHTPFAIARPFYARAGRGGGARATPLNKSMLSYGSSGIPGAVIILLTVE
jgi:hypothetical protein